MCIIIDTNRFSEALSSPTAAKYRPLILWLLVKDGVAVIGGSKYGDELGRHRGALKFFAALERAGKLKRMDSKAVDDEAAALQGRGGPKGGVRCSSDDEHIISLALTSGARIVCTEDSALIDDFKDAALIRHPRGRVYRDESHARLLRHDHCCQQPLQRNAGLRKRRSRYDGKRTR